MSRNQYPGINPHLNSYLQHVKGWKGFHADHLTDILRYIAAGLPDAYFVVREDSLQIGTQSPDMPDTNGTPEESRTEPDIMIFRQRNAAPGDVAVQTAIDTDTPVHTLTSVEETDLTALVIYRTATHQPVTRIELLSPANKLPGSHYRKYRRKRLETLRSSINLVEIDYLHAQRPIDERLPSYPDRDEDSYPYMVLVNNPHPTLEDGRLDMYGFGVMSRMPRIAVPLLGREAVFLDFGAVYDITFNSLRAYYAIYTDTTKTPERFETYTEADQTFIRQQMAKMAAPPPPNEKPE